MELNIENAIELEPVTLDSLGINEEATLALKNSYPRKDRGHRLLYCELAATH